MKKPVLGMTIAEDRLTRRLGVKGALVVAVTPGGAADKAGLCPTRRNGHGQIVLGDVIVAAGNRIVKEPRDLLRVLDIHHPGDTIRLRVRRSDGKRDLNVRLERQP